MAAAVVAVVPVITFGVNLSAFQFVAVIVSFAAIDSVADIAGSCQPLLLLLLPMLVPLLLLLPA